MTVFETAPVGDRPDGSVVVVGDEGTAASQSNGRLSQRQDRRNADSYTRQTISMEGAPSSGDNTTTKLFKPSGANVWDATGLWVDVNAITGSTGEHHLRIGRENENLEFLRGRSSSTDEIVFQGSHWQTATAGSESEWPPDVAAQAEAIRLMRALSGNSEGIEVTYENNSDTDVSSPLHVIVEMEFRVIQRD